MLIATLVTLVFFPVYLYLRAPYARLPLHIDTGYYVSNETIATGRFRFANGWNAHFAGCSKALPEWLYSLIFLGHGQQTATRDGARRHSFARYSRFYASLYNFCSAIAMGVVSYYLSGHDTHYYIAGMLVFGLLSSEPQYGVYYECGETFELLWQAVAVLLLAMGVENGSHWCVGAAAFVWASEAFFIKLSSMVGFVALFGAVLVLRPSSWVAVAAGGAMATGLYVCWIRANGRKLSALLSALWGHERSFGQGAAWFGLAARIREKCVCLARTFQCQPVVPVLCVVGVCLSSTEAPLVSAYFGATVATFLAQATDCWYYQIPVLGPLSLLAAAGVVALASSGALGTGIVAAAVVLWGVYNPIRARRMDVPKLMRWSWGGHASEAVITRDLLLTDAAETIRKKVTGQSLQVYGPFSQAYVLVGASYATPIIVPDCHLDDMCPGWQNDLHRRMVGEPPRFILDTADCFDARAARVGLGLDYRLAGVYDGGFRLFELCRRDCVAGPIDGIVTFRPQSLVDLGVEEALATSVLVPNTDKKTAAGRWEDRDTQELAELLAALSDAGYRRIGVYGAGRYTQRHAGTYRRAAVNVVVVLDDRAGRRGDRFLDWPVRTPDAAGEFDIEAVVISTDRFTSAMTAAARRCWPNAIPVVSVRDRNAIPPRTPAAQSRPATVDASCESAVTTS